MNNKKSSLLSEKIHFPLSESISQVIVGGLIGLINVDRGPTPEQSRIFSSLATHILSFNHTAFARAPALSPIELAAALTEKKYQRLFMQIGIILNFVRHPKS